MTRSASTAGTRPANSVPPGELPTAGTDDESSRVVVRPDGYYWVADDGQQEFGPYATATEAAFAMREGVDTGLEPDETLQEAEREIGFSEEPPTVEGSTE
jgi:hypothetical protein